jgi:uncharacterized phage protein gp47/JayE
VIDLSFSRPTLTELVDRITNDMETRITGVGSLFRRSLLKVLCKVFAGAVHLVYGYQYYMADQLFVSTADENYIGVHATEYGLSADDGNKATGSGTVTGTTGITIPALTKLQSTDGYIYIIDDAVTLAAGTGTVDFTAEEVGADYNDDGSITLTFVSPITNVNSDVTVSSSGITGGTDADTADDTRERVLRRKRLPPHGGALFDYVTWMKEVSGVTRAWAFDQYAGNGTVGCAFVRDDDTVIYPTQTQRDAMVTYLESHTDPASGDTVGIPVGASGGLSILPVEAYSVDFTIQISPNTAAVQTAIEAELDDLFLREGQPGSTLYLSQINEAISSATNEDYHVIVSPTTNVVTNYNQVPLVGTVTFTSFT